MTEPETHSPQQENTPPLLPYDPYDSAKDPRAIWLVPMYLVGLVIAGAIYAVVVPLIMNADARFKFDSPLEGVLNAAACTVVQVLFGAIGLGLGLWARKRLFRFVRFSRMMTAGLWGLAGGLFPSPIIRAYLTSDDAILHWLLGHVAWSLFFAVFAACFLCRRSHVRG